MSDKHEVTEIDNIPIGEINMGFALFAAEIYNAGNLTELRHISAVVPVEAYAASVIQLTLAVTDWIALSVLSDQFVVAVQEGDEERLEELRAMGVNGKIDENDGLDIWLESGPSDTPVVFPQEFWNSFKNGVQLNSDFAAVALGTQRHHVDSIVGSIINDGIISLLTGSDYAEIPSVEKLAKHIGHEDARYVMVGSIAYLASEVISKAAESRTQSIAQLGIEDGEVTFADVADSLRSSITEELIG